MGDGIIAVKHPLEGIAAFDTHVGLVRATTLERRSAAMARRSRSVTTASCARRSMFISPPG
jgi:hypothetical protein